MVIKYDTQVLDYKFQSWEDLSESSKSCLINHTKHKRMDDMLISQHLFEKMNDQNP
jgi:hypothetical protein